MNKSIFLKKKKEETEHSQLSNNLLQPIKFIQKIQLNRGILLYFLRRIPGNIFLRSHRILNSQKYIIISIIVPDLLTTFNLDTLFAVAYYDNIIATHKRCITFDAPSRYTSISTAKKNNHKACKSLPLFLFPRTFNRVHHL